MMDAELVQSLINLLKEYEDRCSDIKETMEFMESSMSAAEAILIAYKAAEEAKHGTKGD